MGGAKHKDVVNGRVSDYGGIPIRAKNSGKKYEGSNRAELHQEQECMRGRVRVNAQK
jgi:hypothetical protein